MHVASGWAQTTTQAARPASIGTPTRTSASMRTTAPMSEWAQMRDPNVSQAAATWFHQSGVQPVLAYSHGHPEIKTAAARQDCPTQ